MRRLVVLVFIFALLVPSFGQAKPTKHSLFNFRTLTCGLLVVALGVGGTVAFNHRRVPDNRLVPLVEPELEPIPSGQDEWEATATLIEPYRFVDKDSISTAAKVSRPFEVQIEDDLILLPYSPFSFPKELVLRFAGKSPEEIATTLKGEGLPLIVLKYDRNDPDIESKRQAIYLHEYMKLIITREELATKVTIQGEEVNPLEYAAAQMKPLAERFQSQIAKAMDTGTTEDTDAAFLTAMEFSYFEVYRLYLETRNSLEVALVQIKLAEELGLTDPAKEVILRNIHAKIDSLEDRVREIGNLEKVIYLEKRWQSLTPEQNHAIDNYDSLLKRLIDLKKVARQVLPKVEPLPIRRLFIIPLPRREGAPQEPRRAPPAEQGKTARLRRDLTRSVV